MRPPETRYTLSGDGHLAFQVFGRGDVDILLLSPGWGHIDLRWEWPGYAHLLSSLGEFSRVIAFDKRGTGLSDRAVVGDIDQQARDALAVLDAVDSAQAMVVGICDGGVVGMHLAMQAPERLRGLVLYATPVRGERCGNLGPGPGLDWEKLIALAGSGWDASTLLPLMGPSVAEDPAFRAWWARYTRASISPDGLRALAEVWRRMDVTELMPQVTTQCLVLHRSGDRFIPVANGRELARLLPVASFVELPGEDYFAWVGDVDGLVDGIRSFSHGAVTPAPTRSLVTVVAVGQVRQGRGQSWAPGADVHEQLARLARAAGGRTLMLPTGPAALFPTVGPAVDAARAVLDAALVANAVIRLGVQVGEMEVGQDPRLAAPVASAAELAELARPGTVLVSRPVADLAPSQRFRPHAASAEGGSGPLLELEHEPLGARGVESLTARERDVLALLGEGMANKQIARRLGISEKTVKNHVTAVLGKLGVGDRTSAALLAARRRL
ncbi:MAG TPA: alpha/beta fold hydrolase [Mycobacteriales bacterium]|nr:alpha/beta fold hydrolase [Mycobacteriales bacterium]